MAKSKTKFIGTNKLDRRLAFGLMVGFLVIGYFTLNSFAATTRLPSTKTPNPNGYYATVEGCTVTGKAYRNAQIQININGPVDGDEYVNGDEVGYFYHSFVGRALDEGWVTVYLGKQILGSGQVGPCNADTGGGGGGKIPKVKVNSL